MITMDNVKELVTFEHEGKVYQMTPEEIEAAYRYQERQYRKCDAEAAINTYVFGLDPEALDGDEYEEDVKDFEQLNGVKYADLMGRVSEIVGLFFQKQDCNVDENQTWSDAITDIIARLKSRTAKPAETKEAE